MPVTPLSSYATGREMKNNGLECETCLHSLDEEVCEECQKYNLWQSLDDAPPADEIDWYPEDIEEQKENGSFGIKSTVVAYRQG